MELEKASGAIGGRVGVGEKSLYHMEYRSRGEGSWLMVGAAAVVSGCSGWMMVSTVGDNRELGCLLPLAISLPGGLFCSHI